MFNFGADRENRVLYGFRGRIFGKEGFDRGWTIWKNFGVTV
jgi:hypothetical protein